MPDSWACATRGRPSGEELELELILSQMAQKPMLRGEVGARALRVRSDVRGHGQVRLCKALGCGRCGCLKPIRACCVVKSAFFLVAPPRGGCAMAPRDSGMCWKQFMMCLEEIQFVAGVHSPPMHDPGRRRNSRPRDGSACARVPVYYRALRDPTRTVSSSSRNAL